MIEEPGGSGETLLAKRTSWRNAARYVIRGMLGFALAYLVARAIADLALGEPVWQGDRMLVEGPLFVVLSGAALSFAAAIPILRDLTRVQARVTRSEREMSRRSNRQSFVRDVNAAFEMTEDEQGLNDTCAIAFSSLPDTAVEVLVADSSNAHVSRAVVSTGSDVPGCGLVSPSSCPAVHRGQTLRFEDPNGLAACPRLRERRLDAGLAATCVPVTIMGTPSAVVHALSPTDAPERVRQDLAERLEGVAGQYGARLGMLRAMSQSRLQADTDPLTGLLNRRAMENRVRELRGEGRGFALAMLDLDRFKVLNDTFGHDTGDRALRLFARVLSQVVRDGDLVCRHGGEEFVVVLPGSDVVSAAPVFHRLREQLAEAVGGSQVPSFTVSVGLCDSSWSEDLAELLVSADRALMSAKEEGRDRLVIDDPTHTVNRPQVADDPTPVAQVTSATRR